MQTQSVPFNQMVELNWQLWTAAIKLRRKLWCMAHAKHVDGESLAVIRKNPRVNHPIKLDVVLYEAEQCQTPFLMPGEPGKIDGIEFDEFGNPDVYEFLHQHPGAGLQLQVDFIPERVPANRVLHWFKMRRPGQHRGVPECASTLNLGAAFRRLREASLSTAEKIAAWTLLLKTLFEPEEIQAMPPMATMDIVHGMMTALPNSFDPVQLKAEQPGPNYETFHKTLLNEQARPKMMPLGIAGCNSSGYNYASGRLDHIPYHAALDVDREDCDDLALDPLFDVWFDQCIMTFGWLGGDPAAVTGGARYHLWDWPKHRVADVESEANANRTKLESGQIFLDLLYSDDGSDFEDRVIEFAASMGVTPEVLKQRLLDVILPIHPKPQANPAATDAAVAAAVAKLQSRGALHLEKLNGNGAHHG